MTAWIALWLFIDKTVLLRPLVSRLLAVGKDTRDVDIIVGGHSHTHLDKESRVQNLDGKDVIIVTDWKWGLNVGKLTVQL